MGNNNSLLDMNQMMNMMIMTGHLGQQARRNDIYEQNSLAQIEQNKIDQQKIDETRDSRQMNFWMKMSDDPRVKAAPGMANQALKNAWAVSTKGKGVQLTDEMLQRGGDQVRSTLDAMANGNRQQAQDGYLDLIVTQGPDDANKMIQGLQNTGKLADQAENIQSMRQLQTARFQKIHDAQAKIMAGELPYSQGLRDFSTLLQGTDSPDFLRIAKAASKIPPQQGINPKTIGANLATGYPEVAAFGGPQYETARDQASQMARNLADQTAQAQQTLDLHQQGEPLPKGTTPRDYMERIEVGKTLLDSYTKMATWADDPYNLTKLRQAKQAQSIIEQKRTALDSLKSSTSQEIINIRQQAQTFHETEAGKKHLGEQAQNFGQQTYLDHLANGATPVDAARRATLATQDKYGVIPDSSKYVDPSKKGSLSLDINNPTTAMRTQAQTHLTGLESTLNVIGNLKAAVTQGNIGLAAALKSTAYGFTSQIKGLAEMTGQEARAAAHKDFTPSRWFDPSLSTVDLLSNTLAYRIINQEQGGRVSDKDFMEMKKRLNISNMMAGKEDVIQRLTTMEKQLQFEQGVYRRLMPKFADQVKGAPTAAPATAEEYLSSIGIGAP